MPSSDSNWVTLPANSNSDVGIESFSYTVASNPTNASRTATLTVEGHTVTVTQSANPGTLTVSPTTVSVPQAGANGYITVTASNALLGWSATPGSANWLYFSTSGVGSGAAYYSVYANPAGQPARSATVTIGNQNITFNQAGPNGAPSYTGSLDSATCQSISGWAADAARPNQSLTVSIYDGPTFITSVTANQLRSDVGAFLGDNGLHGFSYTLPSGLATGGHYIHVYYESSSIDIGASPQSLTCSATANYTGHVDSATCAGISGWAADRNQLNTSITVSLWDGATQIASTTASASRSDVGTFLGDNGLHGFTLQIPSAYTTGTHALQVHYASTATQISGSPVTLTCGSSGSSGVNYTGSVDSSTCTAVSGWAADRNRLNTSITVSLWDGATQVATTTANASRPDVGTFLGDNGLHGFTVAVPSAYASGTHALQVHYASTATQLPGSPVTLTCGSSGSGANYAGNVDSASCSGITGWAADLNRLNTPITVSLWDPATQTQIASTAANASRPDVGAAIGDNGVNGFTLLLPSAYANGALHTLQVRYESSTTQVHGSPVTLTCGSSGGSGPVSYVGFVDANSCYAGISGWAADRNRLNQSIVVSLWDPDTQAQIASTTANVSRPDVGAAIGDNGLHGFTIPIPVTYANSEPHTLQVRFETSTTQLTGSPITTGCSATAIHNYVGAVDTLSCPTISGWVADRDSLNTSVTIGVFDGSTLLTSIVANGARPDVGTFLDDNGLHGFSFATPAALKDGAVHTVTMQAGFAVTVPGPQSLVCSQ
jgi:hypothetical protein